MSFLSPANRILFVKRLLSVVILMGLPIAPASVVWEESFAGDLAGDPSLPTPLAFSLGNNIVKGRMTASAPSDIRDYLTFEIGVGEMLVAIRQLFYTDESGNPGNRGFHALIAGTTSFIPAAEKTSQIFSGAHTWTRWLRARTSWRGSAWHQRAGRVFPLRSGPALTLM